MLHVWSISYRISMPSSLLNQLYQAILFWIRLSLYSDWHGVWAVFIIIIFIIVIVSVVVMIIIIIIIVVVPIIIIVIILILIIIIIIVIIIIIILLSLYQCDINCAGHFTLDALASRPVACGSWHGVCTWPAKTPGSSSGQGCFVNIRYHQMWKVCQMWKTFHILCSASTWFQQCGLTRTCNQVPLSTQTVIVRYHVEERCARCRHSIKGKGKWLQPPPPPPTPPHPPPKKKKKKNKEKKRKKTSKMFN